MLGACQAVQKRKKKKKTKNTLANSMVDSCMEQVRSVYEALSLKRFLKNGNRTVRHLYVLHL